MEIALGLKYVGAGLMFGLAAIGAGVGAGILSSKLIESIARQQNLKISLDLHTFWVLVLLMLYQ